MAERTLAAVAPAVLKWARESAYLEVDKAARKAQVKPERVIAWEAGDGRPTLAQLRKLATVYRRPLASFFRSSPPMTPPAPRDFRRSGVAEGLSSELAFEVRRANFRRKVALDLLEELDEAAPPFGVNIKLGDTSDVVRAAELIRSLLGVPLTQQLEWSAGRESFNRWRAAFERASILVFQTADVPIEEARGFSLFYDYLPVVAVNRKDSFSGRTFTLFHEAAHLALREAGVCDLADQSQIEVFCNAVAAESLVPLPHFMAAPEVRSGGWDNEKARRIGDRYGVSAEVVWRRLLTIGVIDNQEYEYRRQELAAEYRRLAEERRKRQSSGGPSPAVSALGQNGPFYAGLVLTAWDRGVISGADASEFLGIRTKHFPRLATHLLSGGGDAE